MKSTTIFKVGTTDFSANVIAGAYDVHLEKEYSSWTDAARVRHDTLVRTRTVGSIDMFFKTAEDYAAFLSAVAANTTDDLVHVYLLLNDNAVDTLTEKYVQLRFAPVRDKDGLNHDRFNAFTVEVDEP